MNQKVLKFFFVLTFCISFYSRAQVSPFARKIIDTLAAPGMHGRGYVSNGDKIAAEYIKSQFQAFQLKPFQNDYLQKFTLPVNTFPDSLQVSIDNNVLVSGKDYIPVPSCTSVSGSFDLFYFDKKILHSKRKLKQLNKKNFSNSVIIVDPLGFDEKKNKSSKKINELTDLIKAQAFNNKATIFLKDKLTWSVADFQGFPVIEIQRELVKPNSKKINLTVKNKFIQEYQTQNIIGYIPGSVYPDSFIVFSAHYDHLGRLGPNVYFPGANDNASGVSMLLNLAQYYSKPENQQKISLVFIAFGAEEAGLVGSSYFTENPLFPLNKIQFLLNMDLLGTGEDGITVVNASEFKSKFEELTTINNEKKLLKEVKPRGKAANSDHYYFSEKGVKAFFIYTLGGIKAYHDIYDRPETLPLTEYEDLFTLITDFTNKLTAK